MKVIAKVDFISADFGNVKKGQEVNVKRVQGEQLVRLNLVEEKQTEKTSKKAR